MTACCATSPAPRVRNAAALTGLYSALSDATRLRILAILAEQPPGGPGGELCVCHIHDSLGVSQPTASRHLAYLRKAGLVAARREGVWMHYRIVRPTDAVLASVFDAALHALGHADSTNRDRARLVRVAAAVPATV
jgi:ArsR family transcriptional regulator